MCTPLFSQLYQRVTMDIVFQTGESDNKPERETILTMNNVLSLIRQNYTYECNRMHLFEGWSAITMQPEVHIIVLTCKWCLLRSLRFNKRPCYNYFPKVKLWSHLYFGLYSTIIFLYSVLIVGAFQHALYACKYTLKKYTMTCTPNEPLLSILEAV